MKIESREFYPTGRVSPSKAVGAGDMSVCFDIPGGRPDHIMLVFNSPGEATEVMDDPGFTRYRIYLTEAECQEIAKKTPAFFALKKPERK